MSRSGPRPGTHGVVKGTWLHCARIVVNAMRWSATEMEAKPEVTSRAYPPAIAPTTRNGSGPAGPAPDRVGRRGVRRLVGNVLRAGEEPHEGPAALGDVVADRPAEHRVARL